MLGEYEIILRLVVATVLGATVGMQRKIDGSQVGLRTHTLICLGATLFTIVSLDFPGATDTSRVAAGIVAGIGFLGAGVIFKHANKVKGITTAADLWVITAIGIAVGIGYFTAALVATVITVVLLALKKLTHGKA